LTHDPQRWGGRKMSTVAQTRMRELDAP
jgi:hypothetical protein